MLEKLNVKKRNLKMNNENIFVHIIFGLELFITNYNLCSSSSSNKFNKQWTCCTLKFLPVAKHVTERAKLV